MFAVGTGMEVGVGSGSGVVPSSVTVRMAVSERIFPPHIYIKAPNSSESSFELLPPANSTDMTLIRDASGNWTASGGSSSGDADLIADFQFITEPNRRASRFDPLPGTGSRCCRNCSRPDFAR